MAALIYMYTVDNSNNSSLGRDIIEQTQAVERFW